MTEAKHNQVRAWYANVYLALISLAGIALSAFLIEGYVARFPPYNGLADEILQVAVLTVALSLCRSLPLPTRSGQGTDISIIILYATILLKGPEVAVIAIIVSAFFSFMRWNGKNTSHIFNTPLSKTLFNNANYVLSVYAGWLAFTASGGTAESIAMPGLILPSILFLLTTLLVSFVNVSLIIRLTTGTPFLASFLNGVTFMLPTLLAFAPIGYFLALIFRMEGGPYISLIFFVPLVFSRYAYKLYLDSKEQYLRTISTLTAAIEAKDKYTEGHSKRVVQYSAAIAAQMGLRNARIENIRVAAALHDIGKIGIDDKILRKPGKLDPDEWEQIKLHPEIGVKILEEVNMPGAVKEMIHYHHIRYDGGGYPEVGKNVQLPIEVHIISLADAYDAMTSDRPYRNALPEETALGILVEERGKQFHPEIVDVFLKMQKSASGR